MSSDGVPPEAYRFGGALIGAMIAVLRYPARVLRNMISRFVVGLSGGYVVAPWVSAYLPQFISGASGQSPEDRLMLAAMLGAIIIWPGIEFFVSFVKRRSESLDK